MIGIDNPQSRFGSAGTRKSTRARDARPNSDNCSTYLERFEAGGAKPSTVLEQSDAWAAFIARDNPEYAEEMQGIATGAALSFDRNRPLEGPLRIGLLRLRLDADFTIIWHI